MIFILFMITGIIAGTLSGILGIGGGIIVVPMLNSIFLHTEVPNSMAMHFAAGTSLAVMIITTSAGLRTHLKLGNNVWPIFKMLAPGLVIGTIAGATIADILKSSTLENVFGALLLIVAIRSFLSRTTTIDTEHSATPWLCFLAGIGSGTLSGIFGIGGGTILVPFLAHYNVNIRLAVAVATACGLLSACIGTVSFMITGLNEAPAIIFSTGFIHWPAFFGIAIMSPIFAILGAKVSNQMPIVLLRHLFAVLLLVTGLDMIIR